MEENIVETIELAGSVGADQFSMWGLFLQADPVIKVVLVVLVVASFWCWTIIFEKVMRFRRLRGLAEKFEEAFWSGGSLEELYDRVGKRPDHPMAAIFVAAMGEWRRSLARGLPVARQGLTVGLHQRIVQQLLFGVVVPGPGQLMLIKYPKLHSVQLLLFLFFHYPIASLDKKAYQRSYFCNSARPTTM